MRTLAFSIALVALALISSCAGTRGSPGPMSPASVAPAAPVAEAPAAAALAAPAPAYPATRSPVSGLPEAEASGIPAPVGAPPELLVLDWAGFSSAATYTFDDGQPSQIAHYEELNALGVPFTFYVCSGWMSSSPDFDAAWSKAVKDGHEIGNHTAHHPNSSLAQVGTGSASATQLDEIDEDSAYIIEHFGQKGVWTFAAPYGDGGWVEYSKQRFFVNRKVGGSSIGAGDSTDRFNIPCYMASGGEDAKTLERFLGAAHSKKRWIVFLFHSVLPGANWYTGVESKSIVDSVAYAKGFGDMWIDTMAKVASYWLGQKIVAAAVPTSSGGVTTWKWELPEHFPSGMYLRARVGGREVSQGGTVLPWDSHGYYEISLDSGSLTASP